MADNDAGGKGDNVIPVAFQEERTRREFANLLREAHANPIEPDLDLRKMKAVHFSPSVMDYADPKSTHLHLVVYEASTGVVNAAGVLRLTAEQWNQLKLVGDSILGAHLKFLKQDKK